MKINCLSMIQCLALLTAVGSATASPVSYNISLNTSSLSGVQGSLDFNFNPGSFGSQSAQVSISNITGDWSSTGIPSTIGNVTGNLGSSILLGNGTSFNDFFQPIRYGATLGLRITLDGPALNSPNGTSLSGSTFVFSLFRDAAGTIPALSTDTVNGFGYRVDINLNGTTTATSYFPAAATVPEPSTFVLMALGAGVLAARRKRA